MITNDTREIVLALTGLMKSEKIQRLRVADIEIVLSPDAIKAAPVAATVTPDATPERTPEQIEKELKEADEEILFYSAGG